MWTVKRKKSDLSSKSELSTKACSVNVAFEVMLSFSQEKGFTVRIDKIQYKHFCLQNNFPLTKEAKVLKC